MSEKDVVENVDSPGEIAIPIADNTTPGIASFDSNDFTVDPYGKVSSIVERGIPQYLGKITGTGTGTTDLNWEVDWKSRPTVITNGEEKVDKAKRIKIGEYIMLTEHFNQFVSGDIFRITNVQIEGSKYTVKTNNVKALSLASIVGPQGEKGSEGPQGVPYLAYTNSIESTADPIVNELMYLDNGHFNRTPIATSDTYRDVVTVDWYNKTTHRAFMVTGLIQGKNNATNQWVAEITAKTDITGAVGPQGKEGAGIKDITNIDYPHGEFENVQYDNTDGIQLSAIVRFTRDDDEVYDIPATLDIPMILGDGILIDKVNNKMQVEVDGEVTETPNSIVKRDSAGRVKTADAVSDEDAVSYKQQKTLLNYTDAELLKKLDRTGGTITGNLIVSGNLSVSGETSIIESTTLKVADKLIYVAKDTISALTSPAGLITPKYDGTNDGGIVYDNSGTAYVGDIKLDNKGNVDVNASDLQPIATRDAYSNFTNGHKVKAEVDSSQKNVKFVDGGKDDGINSLTDVNLTLGNTTVQYDTTDGIQINSTARFTAQGTNHDAMMDLAIPIVAGDGIVLDKAADSEKVNVKVDKNKIFNITNIGDTTSNFNRIPYLPKKRTTLSTEVLELLYVDEGNANDIGDIPSYVNPEFGDTRSSNGVLITSTPTKPYQAANKQYVDDGFAAKVNISENFVKAFTIPNGTSTGTLAADVKEKLCNPDGHNYYVFDDTSQMILKYSFNADDEIIQYKAIYLQTDKAYEITMQILPSNGKWTRSQTVLKGVTANPTLTGTEDELTSLKVGGTDYKIPVSSGGEAVTPSTATTTATSGTFTSAEWAKLQANNNNYILFNNEIYRLADKAHSGTTGIWSYTHTGWDGTAIMDKSINVTVSTGAWTLVVGQESSGVQFVELYPGETLTTNQLNILKANKGNQIIYYGGVAYYFKLAYYNSSNVWVYESFYDSTVTLTVNMTTGSATFGSVDRKYYRHLLKGTANAHFVSGSSVTSPVEYEMIFITDSVDSMKVDGSTPQNDKLGEYAGCYITAYGTVRVKTSDEAPGNYYAFNACDFKHEGSPGIYSVNYLYMYDPTKYGQLNALEKVSTQIATVDSDTVTEL